MINSVCYRCDAQYSLDPTRDKVMICLDSMCHHVVVHCPYCFLIDHTFLDPESVTEIIMSGMRYSFIEETPEELLMEFDDACSHEMIEGAVCEELESILKREQPQLRPGNADLER